MKCENAQELFSSFWENTIEPPLKVALEQHLGQCPHCNAEYDHFHATVMLLDELPEVDTPPDFHAAVMARVESVRRTAAKPVRWWDLDWQKVFTVRVPARVAALGLATLLLMVLLVRLTPINSITASIWGVQPVSSSKHMVNDQLNAPKVPAPWSPRAEAKYGLPGSGLSISVTPASSTDRSTTYVLRFGTESDKPIQFAINGPGSVYSGYLTKDSAKTCPIAVPSNGGKYSTMAIVSWQYQGRAYTEYVFMPSQFDVSASRSRISLSIPNAGVSQALSRISAGYGIVVLASGDLSQSVAATEVVSSVPEATLGNVLSRTGLRWTLVGASVYAVESMR